MDYPIVCRLLGYSYTIPTTKIGEAWLVEMVDDVIARRGVDALEGNEGDQIREIFDGSWPELVRPSKGDTNK